MNSSRDFTKLGLNLCCPAERQLARNSQKADFGNFMFHLEDDWVDQTLGNILHEAKIDLLSDECWKTGNRTELRKVKQMDCIWILQVWFRKRIFQHHTKKSHNQNGGRGHLGKICYSGKYCWAWRYPLLNWCLMRRQFLSHSARLLTSPAWCQIWEIFRPSSSDLMVWQFSATA